MFANEHHVEHGGNGQRNTDLGEFKESEGTVTSLTQSAGGDDVRRRTNEGDDTADTASECQRHQFAGSGDLGGCADTQDNREQAGGRTSVGKDRGQGGADNHDAEHQAVFARAGDLNDRGADLLRQARIEHGRADDEHTCEQDNRGVGQSTEYLLDGDEAQQAAGDGSCDRRNCQGNDFGNEENRYHSQQNKTLRCLRHKISPPL